MDIWFTLFVVVIALCAATGASLILVGYIGVIPAAFARGWAWALGTLVVPLAGPLAFCLKHYDEQRKPGLQLVAGVVLLLIAVGLLYGAGPTMAGRALDMHQQSLQAGGDGTQPAPAGNAAPAANPER